MNHAISIGQLRQNPTEMIRAVKEGAVYTLTDRGQPVADIAPHRPDRWRSGSEAAAVLAAIGPDETWAAEREHFSRDDPEPRDPWAAAG